MELCLDEARNCDVFVGVLGERYGWVPDMPDNSDGYSVTELEMQTAVLSDPDHNRQKGFFFIRDSALEQ